jgi:uncharacterized membrane protein YgcG
MRWMPGTVAAFLLLTLPAALAAPATAAGTDGPAAGERVRRDDLRITLRTDGSMHVTETVEYDFAGRTDRHGIERELTLSRRWDADRDRVFRLTRVGVYSPSGAPEQVSVTDGNPATIRIGDPGRTVAGVQIYQLDYDLAGVIGTPDGAGRLEWNATGDTWRVPVQEVTATVLGPAAVIAAGCREGAAGALRNCDSTLSGGGAVYRSATALLPGQGLTVTADFPAGTFPGAAPILTQRWSLGRAFSLTPLTVAAALAVFLAVTGRTLLSAVRAVRALGVVRTLGGRRPRPTGVRPAARGPVSEPPPGVLPGDVGRLLRGGEPGSGVAATVLDLAVRGYCRIEELPPDPDLAAEPGAGGPPVHWRLVRTDASSSGLDQAGRTLLLQLLPTREPVPLADLGDRLFGLGDGPDPDDADGAGASAGSSDPWFAYLFASVWLLVLGVLATVFGAILTSWALVGAALLASGPVLLAARWISLRRPPSDRAASRSDQVRGLRAFRRYLENVDGRTVAAAEQEQRFAGQLPFAVALELLPQWVDVITELSRAEARLPTPDWYRPASGATLPPAEVAAAMPGFVAAVASLVDAGTLDDEDEDVSPSPDGEQHRRWTSGTGAAFSGSAGSGAASSFGSSRSSSSGGSSSSGSSSSGGSSSGSDSGGSGSW